MTGAIEIVKKNTAAKEDDPFFPHSFKKESVPDALSAIQIDRETLTGVKVLGAGQFGRVYLAVQSFGADESQDVQRAVKLLRDGASAADKVRRAALVSPCEGAIMHCVRLLRRRA
jgi:hypothetical protein